MRTAIIGLLLCASGLAHAADGDLVQAPELLAPQRGSLAGLYSADAPGAADVSRGTFTLRGPFVVPNDRGPLQVGVFPSYAPDQGISEWGMGWQSQLRIYRFRVAGDLDYASDDLMSPWGRLVRGQDGAYYPLGLASAVRVEDGGDGTLIAYLPDGGRATFGGTPSAVVDAAPGHRYAWYLTARVEMTGETTTLDYLANTSGRPFLHAVEWAGAGDQRQYRVEIGYEPLPAQLPFFDFSSGRELDLDQRVARVVVLAHVGATFQERWRHVLHYEQEPWSIAFYLTEVDTVFPSGASPPPVRYSYSFAADRLGAAAFAPVPALDAVLQQFGADTIGSDKSTLFDSDLDGRTDLEEHQTNTLLRHGDAGFELVPLAPPSAQALPQCRPAAFSPVPELAEPRTLVRMRSGDDADRVLAFSFDPAAFTTTIDVCTREGDPLGRVIARGAWSPGATVRVVDVNRDHQPDLVAVSAGQYEILENTSAAGYGFASYHQGPLSPVTFQPTAVFVQDMNGDGLPDLIGRDANGFVVWFGKGNFQFEPEGQSFDVRTAGGFSLPSLDGYGFAFVDANRDGLMDLLLTQNGQISLFVSTGAFFQQVTVPALDGLDVDASFPVIGDLAGSGNAEIAIVRAGHVESVALDTPGTGLLVSADDGRGNVYHYDYARSPAAAGAVTRHAVLAGVDVQSAGYDDVHYGYGLSGPKVHSVGRFLEGFDHVTRSGPTAVTAVDFLNRDEFAGVVLAETETSPLSPDVRKIARHTYDTSSFQGILFPRAASHTTGFASGDGQLEATERTELDAYDGLCPRTTRRIGAAGTLTVDLSLANVAALSRHLVCLTEWSTTTGRHGDSRLDFVERRHLVHNEVGLVERIESVGAAGDTQALQIVHYVQPGYHIGAIDTPGRGTNQFDNDSATGLLTRVTTPDGVITEVADRDPRTDGIRALSTHRGSTQSFTRYFRYDDQERLVRQWDDLGRASEAQPLQSLGYQYARAGWPATVSVSKLIDAAAGTIANSIDLVTARGEPIGTANHLPEGWAFGPLAVRRPSLGEADRVLRPSLPAGDPSALDLAALLAPATLVGRKNSSPVAGDVATYDVIEGNVARQTATAVDVVAGAVRRTVTENGALPVVTTVDGGGHLLAYVDASGARWSYGYDALGRLRDVELPDGTHQRTSYDDHGRLSRIDRDGIITVEHFYDPQTGLETQELELSATGVAIRSTAMAYDAIGRKSTVTFTNPATGETRTQRFFYDGATPEAPAARATLGVLSAVTGDGWVKRLSTRADGLVVHQTVELTGWRSVTTDIDPREDATTRTRTITVRNASGAQLEQVTMGYPVDAAGRSAGVTLGGAALVNLRYDDRSLLRSATVSGGARFDFSYDDATRHPIGHTETGGTIALEYTAHRNARGLVAHETFGIGATRVGRSYDYTPTAFLASAVDDGGGDSFGYEFDPTGLPSAVTDNGVRRTIQRNGATLVAGNTTYRFDDLGRTIARDDLELAYGPDGHVATAHRLGQTWGYLYDEAGERLLKWNAAGPTAAYLGDAYLDAGGLTLPIRVADQLIGIVRGGRFSLLAADRHGTVLADTNGTSRLASPFGDRAVHPDIADALDYVGKGYDADLGAVRMGVRDYDPRLGRFWTPDPLFLGAPDKCAASAVECNLYGYARGNPLGVVDPTGTEGDAPTPIDPEHNVYSIAKSWNDLRPQIVEYTKDPGVTAPKGYDYAFSVTLENGKHFAIWAPKNGAPNGIPDDELSGIQRYLREKYPTATLNPDTKKSIDGFILLATTILPLAGTLVNSLAQTMEREAAEIISKAVPVSRGRFGAAAEHAEDWIKFNNDSGVYTIDRAGAAVRRGEAMEGVPRKTGFDRDEWPMAVFKEGGAGSSVRYINPHDNRALGAYIGKMIQDLPEGAKVLIRFIPRRPFRRQRAPLSLAPVMH